MLLQFGEHDAVALLRPIEKTVARVPRGELLRHAADHVASFWPEHIDRVVDDELDFLRRRLVAAV